MVGYEVKVSNSSKELTAKERIAIKDFSNAIALDEATQEAPVTINIDYYATCSVHNEKSDNKDYQKFVIVAKDGTKYVTGSESFITSLMDIVDEMAGEEEEYSILVYRKDSKNYKGKQFLTCSIV